MQLKLILALLTLCLCSIQELQGQNAVTPGTLRFDATFENISVNYEIFNDDNLNSELSIRYREVGASSFEPAAKTMRAYPGLMIDGISTTLNFHAGSVFFLQPNTSYEIECTLTDPNGGGTVVIETVTTKTIPQPAIDSNI